ncbi:hypothetical protein CLOM_g4385 [Closterium sp. NIES-68]|nr:hypothetical protein CLOM_g4385 [Closterium sp. NIES-68]
MAPRPSKPRKAPTSLTSPIVALLVLAISLLCTQSHAAPIKPAQEKLLLSLMPYLDDYFYKDTWRAGNDCSKWEGVTCNSRGAVVKIELNFWESGPIPSTITALNSLQHLEISGSNLTGSLPETLGALLTLTTIRVSSSTSGFSGRIPRSLSSLSNLVSLDLFGHRFSGGIPPALSSLKRLTYLALNLNQLSGPIPAGLGSLRNLKTLLLAHNRLTGLVPRQLAQLMSLEELNLQENRLIGPLPGALTALAPTLKSLDVSYNPIGGAFPYRLIKRLSRLETLSLQRAGIKDTTMSLAQLWRHPSLYLIDLSWNKISGNLPHVLGRMKNLNRLYLMGNRLNGSVSWKFFAYKPPLTDLSLADNQLTGEFPWAALKAGVAGTLEHLDINSNSFVGAIPTAALRDFRLTDFNVSDNFFSGKLPEIGRGEGDMVFDFAYNYFWGNPMLTISGQKLCPEESGLSQGFGDDEILKAVQNCLSKTASCPEKQQRSGGACTKFCGASSSNGPCSGYGTCVPVNSAGSSIQFECKCYEGYKLKAGSKHECVRDG